MTDALIPFDELKAAIIAARDTDELKDIRDKASAIQAYTRQRGDSLEIQNAAAEIKLRAERRIGEILIDMDKNTGTQGQLVGPGVIGGSVVIPPIDEKPTLADMGISKVQSSHWQQIAAIPEETFEAHLSASKQADEELTTAGMLRLANESNGRQKPKTNRAGDLYVPQGFDACQTPPAAIDPLLPFLDVSWTVWEPACGEGLLVEALYDSGFHDVEISDLLTGKNFFEYAPTSWDCLVTNPPYSIKYKWLERCYQLGKPFALLLPVETLGAATAQVLFREYGVELILLDKRVNFKMPNKGWDGGGAQFPVAWFTWGLGIGQQLTFGRLGDD